MHKTILAIALAASTLTAMPAFADPPSWASAHGERDRQDRGRGGYDNRGDYRRDGYDGRRQRRDERLTRNARVWRGNDGRYHCRRSDGTTGLIVGAVAGGVLGNVIDGGRQRTLGTLLGAGAGALLGQSVDRGNVHCR